MLIQQKYPPSRNYFTSIVAAQFPSRKHKYKHKYKHKHKYKYQHKQNHKHKHKHKYKQFYINRCSPIPRPPPPFYPNQLEEANIFSSKPIIRPLFNESIIGICTRVQDQSLFFCLFLWQFLAALAALYLPLVSD